jgi:hypothetical protein
MMKRILIALACLCLVGGAYAQKSKSTLTTEINTNWPDNQSNLITPSLLRSTVIDIVNSYVDWLTCTGSGGLVYWSGGTPTCLTAGLSNQTVILSAGVPAWGNIGGTLITGGAGITVTSSATPVVSITNLITPITIGAANALPVVTFNAQGLLTLSSVVSPNVNPAGVTGILSNSFVGNNTGATSTGSSLNGAQAGAILCVAQRTVLITGTNATFTSPLCNGQLPTRQEWELVGGGGGGAGSGTTAGTGGAGTATCVNSSGTACSASLFQGNGGGAGGAANATNSTGGTTSGCDLGLTGGVGNGAQNTTNSPGGGGGASYFGGQGPTNQYTNGAVAGASAQVNTGSGGAGASAGAAAGAGGGGAAGGYCRKQITSVLSTNTYTIGGFGAGGNAGTSGTPGGNGAIGVIIVTGFWQ